MFVFEIAICAVWEDFNIHNIMLNKIVKWIGNISFPRIIAKKLQLLNKLLIYIFY